MSAILDDREMGSIPISIATSLAIDGLYNRHPELKKSSKLPALKAKVIYINARTLFRNIVGAIGDREKSFQVSPRDYGEELLREFDEIKSCLAQEEHPLEAVLYLPTYHDLDKFYGKGNLRPVVTDIAIHKNKLENNTLDYIYKQFKDVDIKPFIETNVTIKCSKHGPIFLLSHLPLDLLNIENASDVYLVESHTGKVKGRELWYTKFNIDKVPTIPFNKGTLLFFGDSGGMFKPQPSKARKRFIEISNKRKWNAYTTKDRLFLGFELDKEPFILKTLRELFR